MKKLHDAITQSIRGQLAATGETQTQYASRTGISTGYVSSILNGKKDGSLFMLEVMLNAVGLELAVVPKWEDADELTNNSVTAHIS